MNLRLLLSGARSYATAGRQVSSTPSHGCCKAGRGHCCLPAGVSTHTHVGGHGSMPGVMQAAGLGVGVAVGTGRWHATQSSWGLFVVLGRMGISCPETMTHVGSRELRNILHGNKPHSTIKHCPCLHTW